MDTLLQDIRYALRTLRRAPGFTAVAVLTLALGIGANTAIFSVVNGVLLHPLPYPEPDRLVGVYQLWQGDRAVMTPANFRDVRQQATGADGTSSPVLEEMAPYYRSDFTLTGSGDPVRLQGVEVGAGFFDVLGVAPVLGRTFRPDENEPGRTRVAILSHRLWQQRFGAEPEIIGRVIRLDGNPYEVVGVMPEGFSFPAERDVWTPIEYDAEFMSENSRGAWYLSVVGRLAPGVSEEQAASRVAAIGRRLEKAYPQVNTNVGMTVLSLHDAMVGDVRTALWVLLGAVGFVLLIACANVANLLLARAASREGELAVRAALGAGRGRLIRQLLTESLILGALGGAAGLLLAVWGTGFLVALQPRNVPRLDEVTVDGTVIAFTAAIALLTGLLFGLVPALQTARTELAATLREGGRGALAAKGSARVRNALVVAEMALAVILLAGAGLLINSFARLQRVDPGFRAEGALAFRLSLPGVAYNEESARAAFYDRLIERLEALPGVRSAGAIMALPLSGFSFTFTFNVEGREPAQPGSDQSLQTRVVTPGYFRTMGIPLLRGRAFTAQDRADAPQVVLISESAVRRYFPDEDPIGRRITLGWGRGPGRPNVGGVIVGVVGDVKQFELAEEQSAVVYVPHAQVPVGGMTLVVRTAVPPLTLAGAVRREVGALDADLPIAELRTLEQLVARSISQPRFYMLLLAVFAGVALALAAIGTFGVMTYAVAQRTREIGIRMALGADPGSVRRLVVGRALALAATGLGVGLLGALALTRLLGSLLYGVTATDPLTYGAVALTLIGVAFLAGYLPARGATRVDPTVALRAE
ncbi:MAG TPA: ABC transporter permease [Longimicrobiales bacterium]